MRIVITGGCGFLGRRVAFQLRERGDVEEVVLFDNLEPQVHGASERPVYLDPEHQLVRGDIRDPHALAIKPALA